MTLTLGQLSSLLNTMLNEESIDPDTEVLGLTEIGNVEIADCTVQRGYNGSVSYIAIHMQDEE